MFNLLIGEFYKWRKSKSFKVCCLVVIVYIIFMYGGLYKVQKGEIENDAVGFSVGVEVKEQSGAILDGIGVLDVEQVVFGSIAGIVATVFVSIFVISEYGNGAIKNIVGKGTGRSSIFLAKYIMTVLAVMVMQLITAAVTLLGGLMAFGKDSINVEMMKDLCQYTGIQLLLWAAFAGVIIAIGEWSRSLGVGISISVGIFALGNLLFGGMDLFFHELDFKPSNYWIINLINECPLNDISWDFVIRVILTAAFWIVVSGTVGILHFKKADVK